MNAAFFFVTLLKYIANDGKTHLSKDYFLVIIEFADFKIAQL